MFTKTHLIQYRQSIQNRQKYIHHFRHQSQPSNKITPWDIIGQALTQRYNQKFRKINQLINCNNQYSERLCSIENNKKQGNLKNVYDLMRTHQPKFVIKRKYLSFDGNKNQDSHHQNKRITAKNQCNDIINKINNKRKEESCNSSADDKKQMSYRKKNRNQQSIDHENILSQEIVSAMIVPNTVRRSGGSKSKYKCIYVKRNRKQFNINPELRISLKKTEAKEIENNKSKIGKFIQHEKLQKMQILYYGSMMKKHRKTDQRGKKTNQQKQNKKQEKKMFRPWSGYQSEQI